MRSQALCDAGAEAIGLDQHRHQRPDVVDSGPLREVLKRLQPRLACADLGRQRSELAARSPAGRSPVRCWPSRSPDRGSNRPRHKQRSDRGHRAGRPEWPSCASAVFCDSQRSGITKPSAALVRPSTNPSVKPSDEDGRDAEHDRQRQTHRRIHRRPPRTLRSPRPRGGGAAVTDRSATSEACLRSASASGWAHRRPGRSTGVADAAAPSGSADACARETCAPAPATRPNPRRAPRWRRRPGA